MKEPADCPLVSSVLHQLIVEPAPLYTFFFSFVELGTQLGTFLELWYRPLTEQMPNGMKMFGDFVDCVAIDSFAAFFSFDYYFKGECVNYVEGGNVAGYLTLGCFLTCSAVAICTAWMVLRKGYIDPCCGGYMAAKWDFERTKLYKCMSWLLLLYCIFAFGLTGGWVVSSTRWRLLQRLGLSFLYWQFIPLVILLYSAYAVSKNHAPDFHYQSEGFRQIRFKRTWWNLFFESNTSFALKIDNAILLGAAGKLTALEAILAEPADAQKLMLVCQDWSSDSDKGDSISSEDEGGELAASDTAAAE